MATVGDVPRPRKRASQDETTPFLLEFEVAASSSSSTANRGRRSQDETAPFPLMLEALRRRKERVRRDEAPSFSLALAGEPEPEVEPTPRARHGAQVRLTLPALTWRGLSASSELREYAARVASGEELPPYSGPILASDEPPNASAAAPAASESHSTRAPEPAPPSVRTAVADIEGTSSLRPVSPASPAKVVLGLTLMLAALVASATAGDDATLRAAGQSVSAWFSGGAPAYEAPSYESRVPPAPASAPARAPCVTTAPSPAR
jgi:hypothetical protein